MGILEGMPDSYLVAFASLIKREALTSLHSFDKKDADEFYSPTSKSVHPKTRTFYILLLLLS